MNYFGPNLLGTIDLKQGDHLVNPYPKGFAKVNWKLGKSGDWIVDRVSLTPAQVGLDNLRMIRDGRKDRIIPPGDYTRLICGGMTVMSDTPAEAREHVELYQHAKGRVLINGLGLAFGLMAILSKPEVKEVLVVEKSKDVIKLIGKQIKDHRVTIINADAFEYQPAGKYDYVWHDIWNTISNDNLDEIKQLRWKYRHKAKAQGAWSQKYLKGRR